MRLLFFGFSLLVLALTLISCNVDAKNIRAQTSQKQLPVLIGKEANQIMKITIINNNEKESYVNEIGVSTSGTTDLSDLENVAIFYTGKENKFSSENLFSNVPPSDYMVFEGNQKLEKDTSYLWVSYRINKNANLINMVDAQCTSILSSLGNIPVVPDSTASSITQRLGVAVRQQGQDGVHTYRIPGLTTTSRGTLLACYDVRRDSGRDLQGDIDIGISRSTDGGNTWEPMSIALDMEDWGGLPEKFNGVSDACLLATTNGDVYLAGLWMHGVINPEGKWIEGLTIDSTAWNHQWRNKGSQAGYGVKQTSQFLISKSSDDGRTWSPPVNITKMGKKEEDWLYAPGPGHGIAMDDGTLVFPTQGRDKVGGTFSNITYSKDGGKTWQASQPAYLNTTESMVVQLDDGSLMLNMRDNRNRSNKTESNGRAVSITNDLGNTWKEHSSSHGALIEPVCMASLHKHHYTEDGAKKTLLLFSNPNDKYHRINQTIKVSFDNGKTWPEENWILLDEDRGAGYSCITSIDEQVVGILYEGSQAHMTFQKIPLSTLLK
ncbi:MAG: BNR-repeat neuraminidase N-terminal domain-containing protein [Allomuricauda sp.]